MPGLFRLSKQRAESDALFFEDREERPASAPAPASATLFAEVAAVEGPPVECDAEVIGECFRTLRAQVLIQARQGRRSFVLVSARPQEGKSTVAVNLAASLAAAGRRVLLVDGDLRRPNIHRLLDIPNDTGLTELLSDRAPLTAVTRQLQGGLSVVTSGRPAADPQAMLLGGRLDRAVEAMKEAFEIVLIDSAPVLSVGDAALVAQASDAVIVVVRSGGPTTAEMRLVRERLAVVGASIVGCVLSQFGGPMAQYYHPYAYATPE